jgi:hypothetical protein
MKDFKIADFWVRDETWDLPDMVSYSQHLSV